MALANDRLVCSFVLFHIMQVFIWYSKRADICILIIPEMSPDINIFLVKGVLTVFEGIFGIYHVTLRSYRYRNHNHFIYWELLQMFTFSHVTDWVPQSHLQPWNRRGAYIVDRQPNLTPPSPSSRRSKVSKCSQLEWAVALPKSSQRVQVGYTLKCGIRIVEMFPVH